MKVTKNEKIWKALTQNLNDFKIQVGWFEETRYDDGTPVGYIAKLQNEGFVANPKVSDKSRAYLHYLGIHLKKDTVQLHIVVPARPFMENAKARINGPEGKEKITQELIRVFTGKQTIEQAANRLGLWAQSIIQEEVRKMNEPALAPLTIKSRELEYKSKPKKKGSSPTKPLNDSGVMFSTVQYKVTKK